MTLSRRELLKSAGAAVGLALLLPSRFVSLSGKAAASNDLSNIAMLVDVTKCIGCWWCYAACRKYNNLGETDLPEKEDAPKLTEDTWSTLFTVEQNGEWSYRKQACMHCTEASCESVCPTGAISHNGAAVEINQEWCIGCGYCVQACPFGVPHKDEYTGTARKCTFCIDRINNGEVPACAEACPVGAIQYGERDALLTEARTRVEYLKDIGTSGATLYGEDESGGLHVMYVLPGSPSSYGLPEQPAVATSMEWVKWLSGVIGGTILAAIPLWLLFRRKKKVNAD
jgi:formate dehydrogenase iron-sulfur subunit